MDTDAEAFYVWLLGQRNLDEDTAWRYSQAIRPFLAFLEREKLPLSVESARRYLELERQRGVAPRTLGGICTALNHYFAFRGMQARVSPPVVQRSLPRPLSEQEERALLRAAAEMPGQIFYLALGLCLETGLGPRVAALRGIDYSHGCIYWKGRAYPLSPDLDHVVRQRAEAVGPEGYLVSPDGPLTAAALRRILRRVFEAAGVSTRRVTQRLYYTYARRVLCAGRSQDLLVVRSLLAACEEDRARWHIEQAVALVGVDRAQALLKELIGKTEDRNGRNQDKDSGKNR